jgi:isocitrate dehydrogenase
VIQLKNAVKELQSQGYPLPDYPEEPKNAEEEKIKLKYAKCIGSNVNPVLRQGNSDRRLAEPVKEYAKNHPHRMRDVSENCKSYVSHMDNDDFYQNEQSYVSPENQIVNIIFEDKKGNKKLLKELPVEKNEILSSSFINRNSLRDFYAKTMKEAKEKDILFSLHLKATMMKVSDPVMFGDAIRVYYKELFEKFGKELEEMGFNPNNGLSDLEAKLNKLAADKQENIKKEINEIYAKNPELYMVDSDRGITNLHKPNDVIIDASIPAIIKNGLQGLSLIHI